MRIMIFLIIQKNLNLLFHTSMAVEEEIYNDESLQFIITWKYVWKLRRERERDKV